MTPAESAPPQNLHPADDDDDPRRICTPPPQNDAETPAESAPEPSLGTVLELSVNRPASRDLAADLAAAHRQHHPRPDSLFEQFCDTYPLKKSKGEAKAAWRKAVKKTDPADIIAAAAMHRDDPDRDPEFTKHPANWLDGECWLDEKPEPRRKRAKGVTAAQRLLDRSTGTELGR